MFMTQWLYVIDCRWQRFAVKGKDGKSDLSIMCYRRLCDDFYCRVFRTKLHQVLLNAISNRSKRKGDKDEGNLKKEDDDKHKHKKRKEDTVQNTRTNPVWLLKESKYYGTLLHSGMHKGKVKSIMWDDKMQSYGIWHHVGSCTDYCGRKYSHCTDIPEKSKRDYRKFIRKCRKFKDTGSKD
eukprot:807925-Ditylum_brightwellii.AAC.1